MRIFFLVFIFTTGNMFGWGEEGHKLIAERAFLSLPGEMRNFLGWKSFVVAHSTDPDTRRDTTKGEAPRHYIDIDFYREFRTAKMIYNRDSLQKMYSPVEIEKQGILPWAIEESYKNLVNALRSGDAKTSQQMMADLAHYVADAHQPMHTILNYNGQLTGQKGIHARYESIMVEKYFSFISSSVIAGQIVPMNDCLSFSSKFIESTHFLYPVIFEADKIAYNESGKEYNETYYKILWFYTKNITIMLLNNAVSSLASLYLSAWQEAGKPDISKFSGLQSH